MLNAEVQKLVAEEFDCLKDNVFLSSSFTTMPPRCVQKTYGEFLDTWLNTFPNNEWMNWIFGTRDEGRREVARFLGCDPLEIAFTKNTTEGIGIIASGYPWKESGNIVIPEQEHPATLYSWIPLAKKGIQLRFVKAGDAEKGLCADDIIKAVDDETQAVVCSMVQYRDGAYVDLKKISKTCKEHGALLIVDAIQAVGRLKVDVKELGIDWMSCGSHKGLLAVEAGGIIYCSSELCEKVVPPYIGMEGASFSGVREDGSFDIEFDEGAVRFEGGSVNTLGVTSIMEGCRFLGKIGIEAIEEHIIDLQNLVLKKLEGRKHYLRCYGDKQSGVVMVMLPPDGSDKAREILKKYKINATIRNSMVRLTINFFNTAEQMDVLANAVEELGTLW